MRLATGASQLKGGLLLSWKARARKHEQSKSRDRDAEREAVG